MGANSLESLDIKFTHELTDIIIEDKLNAVTNINISGCVDIDSNVFLTGHKFERLLPNIINQCPNVKDLTLIIFVDNTNTRTYGHICDHTISIHIDVNKYKLFIMSILAKLGIQNKINVLVLAI